MRRVYSKEELVKLITQDKLDRNEVIIMDDRGISVFEVPDKVMISERFYLCKKCNTLKAPMDFKDKEDLICNKCNI